MSISESRFQMWRAVVSMVHADGVVSEKEREFVESYLDRIDFTDEQKGQLTSELSVGAPIDSILPNITEPADRSMVIHFARLLCHNDGDFHPNEAQVLDRLKSHVLDVVDIRHAIEKAREIELKFKKEKHSGFEGLFSWFTKLL